jgi:hypothetical protein
MAIIIRDRTWYPYLKNGSKEMALMTSIKFTNDQFLICLGINNSRFYASFPNFKSLYLYQRSTIPDFRCFYEIIQGDKLQKPHFDIDVEGDLSRADVLRDNVIEAIMSILPDISLENDILVFSSHGETKRSYHIVVDNWYHANNLEAKELYNRVAAKIANHEGLDHSVYSSVQQFRLLGSTKHDKERFKIIENVFTYKGRQIVNNIEKSTEDEDYEYFKRSLITNCGYCRPLPQLITFNKHVMEASADITLDMLNDCMQLLRYHYGYDLYTFREIKDGIICLKRSRPSYCDMCDRIHEKDHPFLTLSSNGSLYLYCRRNILNRRQFLGFIDIIPTVKEELKPFSVGDVIVPKPVKIPQKPIFKENIAPVFEL